MMVLSFKQFLLNEINLHESFLKEDRTLKASGKNALRHKEKYIDPEAIDSTESPTFKDQENSLLLNRPHSGGAAGIKLIPIKGTTREVNGVLHSDFHGEDGIIHPQVPHSQVIKPLRAGGRGIKQGSYSDEHAFVKMGNFASKNFGNNFNLEKLLSNIEEAKKNPNHELHISKAKDNEFIGSQRSSESEASYYKELVNAAHSIHALKEHKDFNNNFKNRDIFELTGSKRGELSDHYKNENISEKGAAATYKTDVQIKPRSTNPNDQRGLKLLSLKKEKSAQLMSSQSDTFGAIYKHAANEMHNKGKISNEERLFIHNYIEKIKSKMHSKKDHPEADEMLETLHKMHDRNGLLYEVTKEALTGNGKFKTQDGTVTHLVTTGRNATVHSVDEYLDKHKLLPIKIQAGTIASSEEAAARGKISKIKIENEPIPSGKKRKPLEQTQSQPEKIEQEVGQGIGRH